MERTFSSQDPLKFIYPGLEHCRHQPWSCSDELPWQHPLLLHILVIFCFYTKNQRKWSVFGVHLTLGEVQLSFGAICFSCNFLNRIWSRAEINLVKLKKKKTPKKQPLLFNVFFPLQFVLPWREPKH